LKMDIIITVPKSERHRIAQERAWAKRISETTYKYWRVSRLPKKLRIGDRVYFSEDDRINYWQEYAGFDMFDKESFTCEATKKDWGLGTFLMLKHPVRKLRKSVPMKGFRGFRYTKRLS